MILRKLVIGAVVVAASAAFAHEPNTLNEGEVQLLIEADLQVEQLELENRLLKTLIKLMELNFQSLDEELDTCKK